MAKEDTTRAPVGQTLHWQPCVWGVARWDISRKYAAVKEIKAINI